MDDLDRIVFAVVVVTLVIIMLLAVMGMLMVLNNNRRIRHTAELAALQVQREQEVMHAEREATRHTLQEVGRELHDNVGQLLSTAQMGLNNMLEETTPDPRLSAARDALDQGI